MRIACNAPGSLWDEFCLTTAYLTCLTAATANQGCTPYQLWFGRLPSLSHLREIRCNAYALHTPSPSKIYARSLPCILIGYAPHSKAYRLWDPVSSRIFNSYHVSFAEHLETSTIPFRPGTLLGTMTATTPPSWDVSGPTPSEPEHTPCDTPFSSFVPNIDPFSTSAPFSIPPITIPAQSNNTTQNNNVNTKQSNTVNQQSNNVPQQNNTTSHQNNTVTQQSNNVHRQNNTVTQQSNTNNTVTQQLNTNNTVTQQSNTDNTITQQSNTVTHQAPNNYPPFNQQPVQPLTITIPPRPPLRRSAHIQALNDNDHTYAFLSEYCTVQETHNLFPAKVLPDHTLSHVDHVLTALSNGSLVPQPADEDDEPLWEHAIASDECEYWIVGGCEELKSLEDLKVFVLIPRSNIPRGHRALKGKLVCKRKRDDTGKIVRYKVRYIAKGFAQRYGVDYNKTTAPTVRMESIQTILHIAASLDWELQQFDIKTAFLHSILPEDETMFMEQPPGFKVPGKEEWVMRLMKSIYGMKQAS